MTRNTSIRSKNWATTFHLSKSTTKLAPKQWYLERITSQEQNPVQTNSSYHQRRSLKYNNSRIRVEMRQGRTKRRRWNDKLTRTSTLFMISRSFFKPYVPKKWLSYQASRYGSNEPLFAIVGVEMMNKWDVSTNSSMSSYYNWYQHLASLGRWSRVGGSKVMPR